MVCETKLTIKLNVPYTFLINKRGKRSLKKISCGLIGSVNINKFCIYKRYLLIKPRHASICRLLRIRLRYLRSNIRGAINDGGKSRTSM